jgi:predicted Zn-dependent protease
LREPMTISAAKTPVATTPLIPALIFSGATCGMFIHDGLNRRRSRAGDSVGTNIISPPYLDINVQNVRSFVQCSRA